MPRCGGTLGYHEDLVLACLDEFLYFLCFPWGELGWILCVLRPGGPGLRICCCTYLPSWVGNRGLCPLLPLLGF